MKRSTFALALYIKRNKLMRNGEAPIYTRITINGQRAEFGLKRSIVPMANLAMTQKYARILDKKTNGEMAAVASKY